MRFLADDLTKGLNDLHFLLALGNGAVNFFICWSFSKAFHPGVAIALTVFLIWSDRIRSDDPSLMFLVLGAAGSIWGMILGVKSKAREDDRLLELKRKAAEGTSEPPSPK